MKTSLFTIFSVLGGSACAVASVAASAAMIIMLEMHCEAQAVRWSSLAMNEEREKS